MLTPATLTEHEALVLHLGPATRLSDDQFFDLCQQNRDLRFEQSATGDIIIMSPAGGESSAGNALSERDCTSRELSICHAERSESSHLT